MPARLEAIRPRKRPSYKLSDFEKGLDKALEKTGKAMIRDFKRTVATWKEKPEFRIYAKVFKVGSRLVSVTVGTDDEVYGYVSRGTPPHIIRPKNGSLLSFPSGYQAKTKPGRFLSSHGGHFGSTTFTPEVHHPGTEPRKFDELVTERHERLGTLAKNVQAEWDRVFKKGGT